MVIELSKAATSGKRGRDYAVSPVVADALSSALKQFVDRIAKVYPD
jgi:hypothetical protein